MDPKSGDGDFNHEVEKELLDSKLLKVQEKCVNHFLGDQLNMYLEEQKRSHEENMRKNREQIALLQESISKVRGMAAEKEKATSERTSRLNELRSDMEKVQAEAESIIQENVSTEEQMQQAVADVKREMELCKEQVGLKEKVTSMMKKGINATEEFMGLKLQKIPGQKVECIFKGLDPKRPDDICSFAMAIKGEKYEIPECDPKITDLDTLVEKLNRTGNISAFVVSMRKRFKEKCLT